MTYEINMNDFTIDGENIAAIVASFGQHQVETVSGLHRNVSAYIWKQLQQDILANGFVADSCISNGYSRLAINRAAVEMANVEAPYTASKLGLGEGLLL